jgi:K+-transporting ATPase KdpF subunit
LQSSVFGVLALYGLQRLQLSASLWRRNLEVIMETIIVSIIALALFGYLLVVVIRPDKF